MLYRDDRRTNPGPDSGGAHHWKDELTPQAENTISEVPEVSWSVVEIDRLHQLFRDDLVLVHGQSPLTAAACRVAYLSFRAFLVATAGPGRPVGLQLYAVEAWLRWHRERPRPVAPTSLHSYWVKLRLFFAYLERKHGVRSPFRGLRAPSLPSRLPKARSATECLRILEAAREYPWPGRFERARAVAVVAVALYAGLRRADALKLRFTDVDLMEGVIRVDRGKGRGGGKDRVLPIAPELRDVLSEYLRERQRHHLVSPEFFSCLQTRAGMSVSTFRRIVDRVRRASGVPFSYHSLRHSFLTHLLRSGTGIHVVSALAGHTQITTTAMYLRVFDADKERALRGFSFGD